MFIFSSFLLSVLLVVVGLIWLVYVGLHHHWERQDDYSKIDLAPPTPPHVMKNLSPSLSRRKPSHPTGRQGEEPIRGEKKKQLWGKLSSRHSRAPTLGPPCSYDVQCMERKKRTEGWKVSECGAMERQGREGRERDYNQCN